MAGAVRRIGVGERRARLGLRHHLATAGADDVIELAGDLVGLHGTDPPTVFLAAWARLRSAEVASIEKALYDEHALVRIHGMRRTLFVVPVELVPVVHGACTRAIAAKDRQRLLRLLERGRVADDVEAWLAEVADATVLALAARGEATATELCEDEPRLRAQVPMGNARGEVPQPAFPLILFLLAADGRIVRARPRGSFTSGHYRWATTAAWLPDAPASWPTQTAEVELARRWLAAFGPGTATDLKWWTGWTLGQTRRALAAAGAVEVDLDGASGFVLGDDLEPVPAGEPWAALLPALDPTVMGWAGREWFLGEHRPALFDRAGNAGPTVWWDGGIVGGWAQRRDGEITLRLLADVGADARAAIEATAERLGAWLGPVRVTPRFRTPLERELVS
jgi:winged helix DNA-binding protein